MTVEGNPADQVPRFEIRFVGDPAGSEGTNPSLYAIFPKDAYPAFEVGTGPIEVNMEEGPNIANGQTRFVTVTGPLRFTETNLIDWAPVTASAMFEQADGSQLDQERLQRIAAGLANVIRANIET